MTTKSESSRSTTTDASTRRMRALTGVIVAALAGVLVAGSAFAAEVDVAKLWAKSCQSCHGADGKGKTKAGEKSGAKDLASPEIKAEYDKPKTVAAIKDGVKAKDSDKMLMKGYGDKLSPEEIDALADYSLAFK